VHNELVLEQFLDGLEGLSSAQVADAGDEFSANVLVVAHAHFDGSQYAEFLLGNEVQILGYRSDTVGSSLIVPLLIIITLLK
jgi:hypothetical protein